jgi:Lrp/AsnC family leucine-responsive transcriptional regulator
VWLHAVFGGDVPPESPSSAGRRVDLRRDISHFAISNRLVDGEPDTTLTYKVPRAGRSGMVNEAIDDVDRAILYALQQDARNMSSGDIAERTGTSDSTVRKRIQRLESEEIIKGYSAHVDYQKSGYPLRMLLFCTASIAERGDLIPEILAIDGVVSVQELVTGEQNLLVTVVGESDSDITPVAQELLEMGLTVADEVLVRSHETTPFGEFYPEER